MTDSFLFHLPAHSPSAQSLIVEEMSDQDTYAPVECIACTRIRYVNPSPGRVLCDLEDE
jgi:hypothetical protein